MGFFCYSLSFLSKENDNKIRWIPACAGKTIRKGNKESTSLEKMISSDCLSRIGGNPLFLKERNPSLIAPMGMTSFFFAKEKDIMDSGNIRLKKETIALLID